MELAQSVYDVFKKDDVDALHLLLEDFRIEMAKYISIFTYSSSLNFDADLCASLLHSAVELDAVNCARILLTEEIGSKVVPVDIRDRQGRTALHIAAESLSTNCIHLLLSKNSRTDIMSFDKDYIALQLALESIRVQVESLEYLSVEDLIAVLSNDEEIINTIRLLAEATVGIEQLAYGYAVNGSVTAVAMLLLVIRDKILAPVSILLKPRGLESISIYAAVWNEALLTIDISDPEGVERRNSLFSVIELFHYFMEPSGEEISSQETHGTNLRAIREDNVGLLTEVLNRFKNEAPGYLCKGKFSSEMLENVISRRLLHLACKNDAVKCAELLLEGGHGIVAVRADDTDMLGWTPLHISAEAYSEKCISLLLSKGARTDIPLVGPDGRLALEVMLMSSRFQFEWKKEISVTNNLSILEEKAKNLKALKLLIEKTTKLQYMACRFAMKGDMVALALLLMLAGEKIKKTMDAYTLVNGKRKTITIFGCLADKILSLVPQKSDNLSTDDHSKKRREEENIKKQREREILLDAIDLLIEFDAANSCKDENRIVKEYILKFAKANEPNVLKRLLLWDTDARAASVAVKSDKLEDLPSKVKIFRSASGLTSNTKSGTVLFRELSTILLHDACAHDAIRCAKILLEGGKDITVAGVDDEDYQRHTPLHTAARALSTNCIQFLLSKNARTDVRLAKDKHIALETAIQSDRWQIEWSPSDPVEHLLSCLQKKDLSSIKLLCEKTQEVGQVAYNYAMEGCLQSLAMLLLVCSSKILGPIWISKGDTIREVVIHDFVLEEVLANEGSPPASDLCAVLRLLWAHKNKCPLVDNTDRKNISPPSVKKAKSRLSVEEYADQNKEGFMMETRMPDKKISLELTETGYLILTLVVKLFLQTFSRGRCWDGKLKWSNFILRNDGIEIVDRATSYLNPSSLKKELEFLIAFIKKYFCREKKGLISKYPPYMDHFVQMLARLETFSPLIQQRIESHMVLMESDIRLVLIIMLKRFSEAFVVENFAEWTIILDAARLDAAWSLDDLKVTPVFSSVIAEGERRGADYTRFRSSSYRLIRDVAMHPPAENKLEDNHGLELLIASKAQTFLADILNACIVRGLGIIRMLSCVLRGQCTDKSAQLVALLKQSKKLSTVSEGNTGAALQDEVQGQGKEG